MSELLFYVDDSGTRSPDRKGPECPPKRDWFALGGILIRAEDESEARQLHADFCGRWGITYPLHSSDIRFKQNNFAWLQTSAEGDVERFYEDLGETLTSLPVRGLACTIDRPGYNHRYFERYGRQRWSLCKTAFSVIVERAVKLALREGRALRILPERADKDADAKLKRYYEDLRQTGMPFAGGGNSKYEPLSQEDFKKTLREFRPKYKSSPMVQLADLYLYPMCRNGYERYRPFEELKSAMRLVDCELSTDDIPLLGIKYSCFDLVRR